MPLVAGTFTHFLDAADAVVSIQGFSPSKIEKKLRSGLGVGHDMDSRVKQGDAGFT